MTKWRRGHLRAEDQPSIEHSPGIRASAKRSEKIGLVYGHLASNLGDLAVTAGSLSLLGSFVGKENIRVLIPPFSDRAMDALAKLEQWQGEFDYAIVEDALIDAIRGRPPVGDDAFSAFEDLLVDPDGLLHRNRLADRDTLVFNSGEHLFSNGSARDTYALAGRVLPLLAAGVRGRRVICLPSTFGPFADPMSRSVARVFFRSCAAMAARDQASIDEVAKLGFDVDGGFECPLLLDPAFFIQLPENLPRPCSTTITICVVPRLDQFGLRLGGHQSTVNLKEHRASNFETSTSFTLFRELISRVLLRSRANVRLVAQSGADLELVNQIESYIFANSRSAAHRISVVQPNQVPEYLAVLAESDYVVSSRFHSIIFAFLVGRPAVGVHFPEHGHKIPGLMKMFDLETFSVQGDRVEVEELLRLCDNLEENGVSYAAAITSRVAALQAATRAWVARALSYPDTSA